MKKNLLALAVAGAFTSAAWAQSSVTVFGIVVRARIRSAFMDTAVRRPEAGELSPN